MLIFTLRETDFFVSFDVEKKVIIDWLEAFIENFEMISCENINELLDIFIISISIFSELLRVILVVPSRGNRVFNSNTVLRLFLLESFIYFLELLFVCF